MKWGWFALILLLCGSVFAQKAQFARATYSQNGALIGLADLAPLRDCSIQAMEGRARDVKENGGTVSFDLKSKNQRMTFHFPLSRLASSEQKSYQKDFLHKGLQLRATGYACGDRGDPLEAISVDRVY
jgi:hypothetical protein